MLCCVSKPRTVPTTVDDSVSESPREDEYRDHRQSSEIAGFVDAVLGKISRDHQDVPPVLLPCAICTRTFKPQSLEKHTKICERAAAKKRKPFDSAKQRIQGTDLAEFLPKQGKRRVFHEDKSPKSKASWKQTHDEFLRAIRAARGEVDEVPAIRHATSIAPTAAPTRANEKGTCPTCNRQFGIKAYDRHVAWCKERAHRLPVSPATNIAKERLEARINYRAPALKNRRLTNREKYSPGSAVNISSAAGKMSPPSGPKPKESASAPSCAKANDPSFKSKPQAVVRRSGHNRETSSIPGPMKSRLADRTNRPAEETESGPTSTRTSSSNPCHSLSNNDPAKVTKTSVKSTSTSPKVIRKPESGSGPSPRPLKSHESIYSESLRPRINLPSVRGYYNPKLNDICVNQDVVGMSVQPCNIHRDHAMTSWKQISDKKCDEKRHASLDVKSKEVDERNLYDDFEQSEDRHHREISSSSAKAEESIPSSEKTSEKLSWAENIEKLDQTYLITELRESDGDSPESVVMTQQWKPVKNSPRVGFRAEDGVVSIKPEPDGGLDSSESPASFNVHVNFTSTPVKETFGGDKGDGATTGAQELETGKEINASEDLERFMESGTGWSGGMKPEEPMALELGFLEFMEEEDSTVQDTVRIATATGRASNVSLDSTLNATVMQNQSPKIKSPRNARRMSKIHAKLTPRFKNIDQKIPDAVEPFNHCDLDKECNESPTHPSPNSEQIYSRTDSPILKNSHKKIHANSKLRRQKESSEYRNRSIGGRTSDSHTQSEKSSCCNQKQRADSPLNSLVESKCCQRDYLRSSIPSCEHEKPTLNSPRTLESPKDSVGDVEFAANSLHNSMKSPKRVVRVHAGRRRKFWAAVKRLKRSNLRDNENCTVEPIVGQNTSETDELSTSGLRFTQGNSSDGERFIQSRERSSGNSFGDSLKPDFSDGRRCGTYVIQERSVPDVSTNHNHASDESLENKPAEKRRRTDSTEGNLNVSKVERRGPMSDRDFRADCSPPASLTASKIFLESPADEDITADDEMREIYDKYVNKNFDYDSENSIGENLPNEIKRILPDNNGDDSIGFEDDFTFEKPLKAEMETPESNCRAVSEVKKRIRRSMNILRGSTDSLVSMMDSGSMSVQSISHSGGYDREICTIEPIAPVLARSTRSLKFLPEINQSESFEDSKLTERKSESTYWQKVARKTAQKKLINLDPPKESFRLVKRNPKIQFLPPMVPSGDPFSTEHASGASEDYDPFLAAERQMNELFGDTSEKFLAEEPLPSNSEHSPSSDQKVTQFPLSHSSAFVKYPASPRANKRASVIAPPSEFDDFTSDFSSDSTETNSNPQLDFFINNLNAQTREVDDFDKINVEDCARRVVIDKSKLPPGEDVNANSCRGKTFVSSVERSRKILEKVSPKVVRPAVNRSHSVRSTRATSAPRAPERKSSLKKSISHKNDYSDVSNASNNNSYAALSGSNLSLSSMLSSEADIKRSNSVFDELLSSFEDDGSSFPSLKSFLKNDSVSTSMSSQVPDGRLRNGMISDEELSSPDSYKRQNHSKLSADSAYSSLNRKYSNLGRSTTDVGSRIEQEPSPKRRDEETAPGKLKMSKFCHECGFRFPEAAKFCCDCGVKRLVL